MITQVKKTILTMGILLLTLPNVSSQKNDNRCMITENNPSQDYIVPIVETFSGRKIRLYADWERDEFTFTMNKVKKVNYHIFDNTGKILKKGVLNSKSTQVDVSDLPSNTYFLTLVKRDDEIIQQYKIIKKEETVNNSVITILN